MSPDTLRLAWSKVRFFYASCCVPPHGDPDSPQVARLLAELRLTAGFSTKNPPLLGFVEDGEAVLLTGAAWHVAALAGGFPVPVYPLDPRAMESLEEADHLRLEGERLRVSVYDREGAVRLLREKGFPVAAELLAAEGAPSDAPPRPAAPIER